MSRDNALRECAFETERLSVREWTATLRSEADREGFAAELLTPSSVRWLPGDWSGEHSIPNALRWLRGVELSGATLLTAEILSTGERVGLLIVSPQHSPAESVVHVGYVIAESQHGKGFATELVSGFCEWARHQPQYASVIAGVDSANISSIRVLEKCGFALNENGDSENGTLEYRISLQ